ncbi:putative 3',5'-cyclic-nucleotide phosphodiesterase [Tolypocladium ophioglossoides CBS 100239]|uniref:Putative 3',5'-cyclic-nucleotide phosphodiesterase n=1 Tax=Tolypocladium ophioglossoides (strain CBS 100239) TaxID=1163406 RepID=A0A0L0N1I7_TOLOC|nr:putative 3',5'-cyclic-nucleotide phosphodiesterase [Tolypocladium ophioglossoides CBS 100239]
MGEDAGPALQVIVLGSGGGPQESNVTAFLVRSVSQAWSKGSIVAVDAGVHLSAITRLIHEALPSPPPASLPYTLTTGPFAGLSLPHSCPAANAAHVSRNLVDTFLITHPHLDHISGFVINTAGLPGTRPKKLAGLPSTIQAFKSHIFNNVIWPNLSDENNGAGLLTYLRLVEGGSPAFGDGEGKGYLEVCDGLLVKTWSVSHGHCIERHSHRGSASSASPRFGSHDASNQMPRRDFYGHPSSLPTPRGQTLLSQATFGGASPQFGGAGNSNEQLERYCVYDSSAYFIQDDSHRREVLIFGDVEPDSISLSPRNLGIWQEAALKIVGGTLAAIFIECSYDDSQSNDRLFGHLKPVFVMEELRTLAGEVEVARRVRSLESRKRKRVSISDESPDPQRSKQGSVLEDPVSPKSIKPSPLKPVDTPDAPDTPHLATPTDELSLREAGSLDSVVPIRRPLEGLKVVIIHVKERLTDGPNAGDSILQQLREYDQDARLGCEFVISKPGQSFYL